MSTIRAARRSRTAVGGPGAESGQVLLLALVFVIAFGVLISLLLAQIDTNIGTTVVVRNRTERAYATDAAIEYTLEQLVIDPTLCTSESPTPLPSQTVNGRTASLSCRIAAGGGTPLGASGFAVVITGKLDQQGGGTATFSGTTYVKGAITASLRNVNGSVSQFSPTCPGTLTQPAGLTVSPTPPYRWQCTTAPPPDPPHVLPPVPGSPKAPDTYGNCRVFYPGTYTAAPALLANNYFVSGTYYFKSIGLLSVANGVTIVGGFNPTDTNPIATSCKPDADSTPGGGGSGFGVQWIFGGSSALAIGNNDKVELHSRIPGPAEVGTTPRISFYAIPPASDGYLTSVPSGGEVLDTSSGHPSVAIHGLFYGPTVDVNLDGPNGNSLFRGGAVINDVHLKLSAAAPDAPIFGVDTITTHRRTIIITAKASSPRAADVTSTVVAEVRNNTSPPTIVVRSWRTR